ncbi:MAG: 3'-5' exonuclease [Chitinophagaceae bacterium]|nr:MAG: 3'-5' exonuclease [Chitinophagaceae bacterium]
MIHSNPFLLLERPVIFFDLETTGLNQGSDRIVELFATKLHPNGNEETVHHYVNPTILIPAEATAIHGISNEFVADMPTFESLASELAGFFDGCDLSLQ